MSQPDELPPCVGEAMRDILAERAIRLLDDWYIEAPEKPSERRGDFTMRRYSKSTRGSQRAVLSPFYRMSED